ncbi:inositol monophosphatase family protein [Prochlorothrix hollandica]|uniref:inositol monophosphatase family protein n=1 Tax=Prochlorothrix hollandica TaxID=1223 RepID=UPI0009D9E593|nr:inositol monophosphatase family protein [Prochlorothrix hollandica]
MIDSSTDASTDTPIHGPTDTAPTDTAPTDTAPTDTAPTNASSDASTNSSLFWAEICQFAHDISERVGLHLKADFGTVHPSEKSDGSWVTRCDRWADQALRDAIAARFPDHGLLTEETLHEFPPQDWCWIVDPLDGTTNFALGIPMWGISLGLLYRGTPVFGCVHFPVLGQTFHGFWAGNSGLTLPQGAFCNHQPIRVSTAALSPNQLFSFCTRSITALQQEPAVSLTLPLKVRMLGVSTYNLLSIASGMTLGGVEATPKVWDIAATWAIVHAAGAQWIPLQHQPFPLEVGRNYQALSYPTLVVARPDLAPQFLPFSVLLGSPA